MIIITATVSLFELQVTTECLLLSSDCIGTEIFADSVYGKISVFAPLLIDTSVITEYINIVLQE